MARRREPGLTRKKLNKLKKLIKIYPQQEAASIADIAVRTYSRKKNEAEPIYDAVEDGEIDYEDLSEEEQLLYDFYDIVSKGVPQHHGQFTKIMRDEAFGEGYVIDKSGKKKKTNWVAAKEYLHMLTFATKEAREEREAETGGDTGVIEIPSAGGQNLADLIKQQQAYTQSLAQAKRQENGDDD